MAKPRHSIKGRTHTPDPDPDAELDEFARAMAGVRPLTPDVRSERVLARPSAKSRITPAPASESSSADVNAEVDDRAFVAAGVDRRELRKLKRGDPAPGDAIDVHGMTSEQAETAVSRFIERSRTRHCCVCIVHGRGLHSPRQVAVLKTRVRALLREHRAVLAFADAPPAAGGAGAVYVLLRR